MNLRSSRRRFLAQSAALGPIGYFGRFAGEGTMRPTEFETMSYGDLIDRFHVCRGEQVVDPWPIAARGAQPMSARPQGR